MRKTNFVFMLVGIFLIVLLFTCEKGTSDDSASSWDKEFEVYLNDTFAGKDSGIISFKVDYSLIYVEVDDSVPRIEYPGMARAWALKLSEEKQKHTGSSVTAYITKRGKIYAKIDYNKSKGFH